MPFLDPGFDAVGYEMGFVEFVEGAVERNGLSSPKVGPEIFPKSPRVVSNQGIGGIQDGFGRSVVLFKPYQMVPREVALEVLDVFNLGAAPAINGLVIITYGK